MGTVVGSTLMRARNNKGLEREDLARAICTVSEHPEKATALTQALRRVEHAPGESRLPDNVAGMLEVMLDLERGDLAHPYRWAYRLTGVAGSGDRLLWLQGTLLLFSDAVGAHEARQWVTGPGGRTARPIELAHPYEVFHGEIEREIGGDWSRVAVDPPRERFVELVLAVA